LLPHHLFGPRARSFVIARAKLQVVSEELTPHGWKIVLLTRLIPFFPSKISNYFFGLTTFSLHGFVGSYPSPRSTHFTIYSLLSERCTNIIRSSFLAS
jgi:uncharacterized membrane protein YdjX (TVP38/TMEM64 family)